MLYASTNPITASGEIGVLSSGNDERYSLIVYEIVDNMTLSRIGRLVFPPQLEGEMKRTMESVEKKFLKDSYDQDSENIEKVKILNEFLLAVFSGPMEWHPVSQHICRYFFPLPHGFDGWLYPCVEHGWEDHNVCLLDAHARAKLNIIEVLTMEKKKHKAKPSCRFARRPKGDRLVRVSQSKTRERVFGNSPQWGFWRDIGVDYVEEGNVYWPS